MSWRTWVLAVATVLSTGADQASDTPVCAVIPFKNLTGQPGSAYLADVIHQSLHFAAGKVQGWRLVERARLKELLEEQDLAAAGVTEDRPVRVAGADLLILGEYRDDGGIVSVTARLVEQATGSVRRQAKWSGHVSGIADDLAARLTAELAGEPLPAGDLPPEAQGRFEKACRLLEENNVDQAIKTCDKILDEHRRHVPTLLFRGEAELRKKGWSHQAVRDFEKVLEIDEENVAAKIGLARASLTGDRRTSAQTLGLLDSVLKTHPDDGQALWVSALVHERAQEIEPALARATRATQELPHFGPAWHTLARLQMTQKKYRDALKSSSRATTCDPKNPACWTLLGDAQLETGQREKARESFRKALECNPPPDLRKMLDSRLLEFR